MGEQDRALRVLSFDLRVPNAEQGDVVAILSCDCHDLIRVFWVGALHLRLQSRGLNRRLSIHTRRKD